MKALAIEDILENVSNAEGEGEDFEFVFDEER
jgi:hypothetical protein